MQLKSRMKSHMKAIQNTYDMNSKDNGNKTTISTATQTVNTIEICTNRRQQNKSTQTPIANTKTIKTNKVKPESPKAQHTQLQNNLINK